MAWRCVECNISGTDTKIGSSGKVKVLGKCLWSAPLIILVRVILFVWVFLTLLLKSNCHFLKTSPLLMSWQISRSIFSWSIFFLHSSLIGKLWDYQSSRNNYLTLFAFFWKTNSETVLYFIKSHQPFSSQFFVLEFNVWLRTVWDWGKTFHLR